MLPDVQVGLARETSVKSLSKHYYVTHLRIEGGHDDFNDEDDHLDDQLQELQCDSHHQAYDQSQEEEQIYHDFEEEEEELPSNGKKKKKDKKLVFLSRSVLQKIRERPMTTGTQIANEILELYKRFSDVIES